MLRQIFAVVFIALSTQITANPNSGLNIHSGNGENLTAVNESNSSPLNVTSIQDFLLKGTITESMRTEETETGNFTYQFHDFGVVDIIGEKLTGEYTISTLFWNIEETSDGISIILADPPTGLTFELIVEGMDDGALAITFDGKSISFETNSTLPSETIELLESQLSGTWGTKTYPFDVINSIDKCGTFEEMNGAYLSYHFHNDGTYSRMLGSQMVAMEEAGVWEITKDGQFVIFYAAAEGDPEYVTSIQVAKIKSVSGESMVLSQAITVPKSDFDTMFCTATKDFKMNKSEATSAIR